MDNTNTTVEHPSSVRDCRGKCGKGRGASHAAGSGIYGLAFLGAVVYYIQHSATFWAGVLGVLKALIWPATVVYKFLDFFKM